MSLIARADPARLAGFKAAGPSGTVRITDVYLDTAPSNGLLLQRGMRARLRFKRGSVTLAVKRPGVVDAHGVTTRVELQAPATRSRRPERWPPSAARTALLDATGGEPLQVIARLRQRRFVRLVRRGATVVELSLDALEATTLPPSGSSPVVARRHELEAELVEGDGQDLAELAGALGQIDGVGPPLGSKLAFALAAGLAR